MTDEATLYDLLEIGERATPKEVRTAFYRLSKVYHPDTIAPELRDTPLAKLAEDRLKDITEAYAVLSDRDERAAYDEQLRAYRADGSAPNDHFSTAATAGATASSSGPSSSQQWNYQQTSNAPPTSSFHSPSPPASSTTLATNITVVVIAIVIAVGLFTLGRRNARPFAGAPDVVAWRGACPDESCHYDEEWRARTNATMYREPQVVHGAMQEPAQIGTIAAGTWTRTLTGALFITRGLGVVDSNTTAATGLRPPRGDTLALYENIGGYSEGWVSVWLNDSMTGLRFVRTLKPSKVTWWVKVQTTDARIGWIKMPREVDPKTGGIKGPLPFVSREHLNDSLATRIGVPYVSREVRMRQIDSLIVEGADVNGDGGRYGTAPLVAAIESHDTLLMNLLAARGLRLRATACPYSIASESALRSGGDVMLRYLLAHGPPLACMKDPLQWFLISGISGDDYPVDQAMEVARLLMANGARATTATLNLLNDPRWAARVRPILSLIAGDTQEVAGTEAYSTKQVDEPVVRTGGPAPRYPQSLRAVGSTGVVTLRFVVGVDGKVESRSVTVVNSTSQPFEGPAIDAVMNGTYKPARIKGVPVRQLVEQVVRFETG